MRKSIALMACAALASFGLPSAFAADGNEAIEEVVVTGSYLKRTAQDSPSPLSVITSADIEDIGAADVAEIIQTLPWQSGSQSRASTFQGEGADGRNSVNLRNLGHGATLVLVNGKRNVASWFNGRGNASVNINGLVPNIALERMEIVKDGAAALYGSDAIAGVVNFITKKNFEGMDFTYQWTTDDETGEGDANQAGLIFGVQGDRGGIVASVEFLNRDEINVDDRYDRFGGSTVSSTGQPGRIQPTVPGSQIIWAAHGLNPGQPVGYFPISPTATAAESGFGQADLNCADSAALEQGGPLGTVFGNLICAYDFGSFFALQAEESLRKFHITGHYDVSDSIEAYFEFASNDSEFDRKNSLNPNALNLPIPVTHFGNIEDAFRRGIEPIVVSNRTRLVGGTRNTPAGLRPIETFTETSRTDQRINVGFTWDGEFGDRAWTIDASYTATEHDTATSQVQDTLSSEMLLAINGLGGPNCNHVTGTPGEGNLAYAASGGDFLSGNCYFFNPFGNSNFDRNGNLGQGDLTLVNPPELYEWLLGRITNDAEYRQRVIDVVASGELFDMPAGSAGLAVGFQRRRDKGKVVLDAAANTNNLDFAFGAQDWSGALTTTAFFVELALPLHETLELNLAARYEDFDEIGEDTTDPKLTLLWQPSDSFSLRASIGSSFKAPSLIQLFGSLTTVANQTDFGGDAAFRPSITTGNPNLQPESADTWNLGITWAPQEGPLEGLQVDIDYYTYEYEDIITRQASAGILLADNQALQAFIDANPGATLASAVAAGAGNRDQVVRNGQGLLLRILPDYINADSADITGIDLNASYTFETDFGLFRAGLQVAFVEEYEVEAGGTTFDAVGQYNEFTPVARPLPEFKANASLAWSQGNHRAFLMVQHVDEVDYGIDLATDPRGGAARFWNQTVNLALGPSTAADFFTRDIDSFTTADVQYTYTFGELGLFSDSRVTLGIKNVTNEEPPFIPVITSYDGTLHDPRGRMWFLRVGGSI